MTNLALDRSTSVQKLKDADCPALLAEAIVDVVSINRTEVATKSDFEAMKKKTLSGLKMGSNSNRTTSASKETKLKNKKKKSMIWV
ncbi:MAG: hypothetical protein OXH84_00125 [Gammaproteobacteria bacterium]|nr:hypothetical protein [Gammaproteobacteria bacterium]